MAWTDCQRHRTHRTLPPRSSRTSSHSCKRLSPVRERTTRCRWWLRLCLIRTSRILQLIFRQSRSMSSRCRVDSNYRFATCKTSAAGKGDRTRPSMTHDIIANEAARWRDGARQVHGSGVVKSLELTGSGPVVLVHTQKIEAQSEKPTWTKAL